MRGKLQRVPRRADGDRKPAGQAFREEREAVGDRRPETRRTPRPVSGCNKPEGQNADLGRGSQSSGVKPKTGGCGTVGTVPGAASDLEHRWRGGKPKLMRGGRQFAETRQASTKGMSLRRRRSPRGRTTHRENLEGPAGNASRNNADGRPGRMRRRLNESLRM